MNIVGSASKLQLPKKMEHSPKVAILDFFYENDTDVNHGDQVESIVLGTSGLSDADVQNYQNSVPRVTPAWVVDVTGDEFLKRVDYYTEKSGVALLDITTKNLSSIIEDENSQIRVINESQSQSPAQVAQPFINYMLENETFLKETKKALSLKQDTPQ